MISISFDEGLTLINAQYCRDLIGSEEYQALFGHKFQIRKDADSKGYFMNDKGGFRISKTTGANITGHKGTIIVVDDPQNPKTSESEVFRKQTISYYTHSLYNRLTPINLGVRIIIMQRLHQGDLTGYLLKKSPENYHHICLPATINKSVKPEELKEKYVDGLLDPIRLSSKELVNFRKVLGSVGYAGQYDQDPAPDEGGILKSEWFDIIPPQALQRDFHYEPIHFIIDPAYTKKQENDPTAIMTCFVQQKHLYILDVHEVWLEFPDLIKYLTKHVHSYQYSSCSKIFIEPKASGKSIVHQLRATTNLNVIESTPPDLDKVTRANSVAPALESRRAKLVEGPYMQHFLDQLRLFPNAEHDDMVDTLVIGMTDLLLDGNPDFLFL
jgi:predicted phage terminase large subunit-like protein